MGVSFNDHVLAAFREAATKRVAIALVTVALLLNALIPAGFMLDTRQSADGWSIVICPAGLDIPHTPDLAALSDDQRDALAVLQQLEPPPPSPDPTDHCGDCVLTKAILAGNQPHLSDPSFEASLVSVRVVGQFGAQQSFTKAQPRAPPVI